MSNPAKGRADYWKPGDWNALCYQCGRKRKAGELMRYWQGYYVCPEHWEVRQPQDFVRAVPDIQTVPWAQPVGVNGIPQLFVTVDESSDEYELEISTDTVTAVNYTLVIITILEGVYIGVLDFTSLPDGWTLQINNFGGIGFTVGRGVPRKGPGKDLPTQIDPDTSTVVAVPDSIQISPDTSTVTVTLLDSEGALVAGVPVILESTPAGTISPIGTVTDGSGEAVFTFGSATEGTYTLSAFVGTATLTQQPEVTVANGYPFTLTAVEFDPLDASIGYSGLSGGSISPTTYLGDLITALYSSNGTVPPAVGDWFFRIVLNGTHSQDAFTSVTVNGSTFNSADATFSFDSMWVWGPSVTQAIPLAGSYDVVIIP